jgi:hypothetical protein
MVRLLKTPRNLQIITEFSSIKFFIYLLVEFNSHWQITESARIQKTTAMTTQGKKRKMGHLRLFALKHELLEIFVYLQTLLAAESRTADRH